MAFASNNDTLRRRDADAHLVTGYTNAIRLRDAVTGKDIRTLTGHKDGVNCLAFSGDGKKLVSGGDDNSVRLWEVASGKELACFTGHKHHVGHVVFSPSGTWVASSAYRDIRFWDLETGKQTRLISAGGDLMFSLALSPDGSLVAVESHDHPIRVWQTATGKPLNQFKETNSQLEYPHCFLSEGKTLLTYGHSGGVTLWDVATGAKLREFKNIWLLAVSPDGKLLATGPDWGEAGRIRLWDLTTGKEIRQFQGHQDETYTGAFSPDSKVLVSFGGDHTLRRWNVNTGEELDPRVGHQNAVTSLTFSVDGKLLASGSADRTVRLWDPLTGREVRLFRADQEIVEGLAFLRGGETLLSQNAVVPSGRRYSETEDTALTRVRLWDVSSGRERRHFDLAKVFINQMAFSHRRQLVAQGGSFETLRLLDPVSGTELPAPKIDQRSVMGMAFSPDGNLLAITSDESGIREGTRLCLWNLGTGKKCWEQWKVFASFKDVVFSPDSKMIATGGGVIRLWDSRTSEELRVLRGGRGHLAFSPDGRTLATCGQEGDIVIWDVIAGKQRRRFAGHEIACMAFSPDGRLLATGGADTLVMVWDVTRGK